jgi:hypothetical protein
MAITAPTADPRESGSAFMPELRQMRDQMNAALVAPSTITSGLPWDAGNLLVGEVPNVRLLNSGYDVASNTGYIRSVHTDNGFSDLHISGRDVKFFATRGDDSAFELLRLTAEDSGLANIDVFCGITQFTNTAFYPGAGASVNRFDRVLMGGAVYSDASFPNVEQDWMEEYSSIPINGGDGIQQNGGSAQVSILTHKDNYASAIGLFVGARNVLQTIGQSTVYAIGGVVVNDNTDAALNAPVWIGYWEGIQATPEAGATTGFEIEMRASGLAVAV